MTVPVFHGMRRPFGLDVKAWAELVRSSARLPHATSAMLERCLLDDRFYCRTFLDWDPMPWQDLWMRGKFKVGHAVAGRRGGKTEGEAARKSKLLIFGGMIPGQREPRRCINTARTVDQSHLVPNTMVGLLSRTKIGRWFIEDVSRHPYMKVKIRGSGAEMWARTTQNGGDNLRGHWANDVHRDEAALGAKRDMSVILPMLIDRDGTLSGSTTPKGRNFYFIEWGEARRAQARERRERGILSLQEDVELLDTLTLHWTTWDNPHNSRAAIERFAAHFSPDAKDQELWARFREVDGALCTAADLAPVEDGGIRDDDLELHREIEYIDGAHFVAGLDFGRWRSFTVVIVMRVDVKPWRAVWVYASRRKGWGEIKGECERILRRYRASALLDTTKGSVGDVLHEWIRVPGERFEFGGASKEQLMLNLKIAIKERSFILPGGGRWEELFRQMALWGTEESGEYGDETWDYLMALALAVWQAKHRPERPGEYATSTQTRNVADFSAKRGSEFRPRPRPFVRRKMQRSA